jgi:hypothetical protein
MSELMKLFVLYGVEDFRITFEMKIYNEIYSFFSSILLEILWNFNFFVEDSSIQGANIENCHYFSNLNNRTDNLWKFTILNQLLFCTSFCGCLRYLKIPLVSLRSGFDPRHRIFFLYTFFYLFYQFSFRFVEMTRSIQNFNTIKKFIE